MHWGIQTNLGKETSQQIIDACEATGTPYTGLLCIPFSFAPLPELPTDVPTTFWGSIGFIEPIWKSQKWNPGVIFNENFDYRVWSKKWWDYLLNQGQITTLDEFSKQNHAPDSLHFIRPCADDKAFTGQVIEYSEVETWMRNLMCIDETYLQRTGIVVSEPVGIEREWRLYMLNGKPMSGSQYRENFRSIRSKIVPKEVYEFGERMASIWSPAELFTLDIAQSGGDLYVNEMGTFHSAGMYEADVNKIVSDINNHFGG